MNTAETTVTEKKAKTKWPKERIAETALKYPTKGAWAKSNDQSAYQAARKLGNEFLATVCSHMDKPQRGRKKKEVAVVTPTAEVLPAIAE